MTPKPRLQIESTIDNGRVAVTVEIPGAGVFEAHTFEVDDPVDAVVLGFERLALKIRRAAAENWRTKQAPNFVFCTGHREPFAAGVEDRRFTVLETKP